MSVPELLQPLTFPLRGSRLIEASAGTGKTFTIAALYLRLVLGHGGEAAFPRALTPPEILVVTFTEAATKELRDRIRAALAEAADCFLGDPDAAPASDLLGELRAAYPPEAWPACARRLRLAAEWMDEAAVSTIHGWCNRMLREHAFDSDSLFTQTLEADSRELLAEVVRDYWRSFFYPLDEDGVARVAGWWATPDALQKTVARLLDVGDSLGEGLPPAEALGRARDERERELMAMRAPWTGWIDALQALLDDAAQRKLVDGRRLQARFYQPWLDGLRQWAAGECDAPFPAGSTGWTRLTPQGLADAWKSGPAPDHPALHDLATLRERLDALPDGRDDLLAHAARWCAGRLAREKERRAQMGFDDLLSRLDAALQGANGARLAALIRRQFPVALIDEFQDTDPLQYRIFDAVYGVAGNAQDTALVLIGDPKQAIYAFRGADIHTYLAARRDTAGRHATLGTNYRSTRAMVGAVNQVFGQAERRSGGQGAFLFRTGGDDLLPFVEVAAQGRDERWCVDGAEAPALTCWHLDAEAELGTGELRQRMAAVCTGEVVRLLRAGQDGRAGFAEPGKPLRALQPGDIAVLVNNGREADAVREALKAGGVRTVYLSDRGSVFRSAVAADLKRWLAACAEPGDDRLLRAALATATLGLPWAALDRLSHDELHWESRVEQFHRYRECWRRQGVLPMLRRLLHDFAVPERLLAQGDERTLTDVLHLAELLQQASAQLDGEHALIRHLAAQDDELGDDNDARRLRLESDADLVKVVTVHKSKGLEYPLVFLPFACAFRPARGTDLPLVWHDAQGGRHVALAGDAQVLAAVDHERLGEDLRKLYVALTRARFATWVGVAPAKGLERSALGYLLAGGEPVPPAALAPVLHALRGDGEAIRVQPAAPFDGARFVPRGEAVAAAAPLPLPERREAWWVASYSALRTADERIAPDSAAENTYADAADEPAHAATEGLDAVDEAPVAAPGLHGFPRGAGPGSFLHGLLEWAGRQGFAAVGADPRELADLIARRCNLRGWSGWIEPLRDWLGAWLATPLDLRRLSPQATPVRPAALRSLQVEMEFWFPAHRVDTRALDALVCRHTLGGAPRAPLQAARLNGMLKGFVDLVFEHEGRYYVADYKSNWLGPRDASYAPQALREAVLRHRYDLQYVLYLFALHRLLRARLPGYDYDRHVGGAVYLFLRGHAAAGQGLHMERPPKVLMEVLDALFTAEVAA